MTNQKIPHIIFMQLKLRTRDFSMNVFDAFWMFFDFNGASFCRDEVPWRRSQEPALIPLRISSWFLGFPKDAQKHTHHQLIFWSASRWLQFLRPLQLIWTNIVGKHALAF